MSDYPKVERFFNARGEDARVIADEVSRRAHSSDSIFDHQKDRFKSHPVDIRASEQVKERIAKRIKLDRRKHMITSWILVPILLFNWSMIALIMRKEHAGMLVFTSIIFLIIIIHILFPRRQASTTKQYLQHIDETNSFLRKNLMYYEELDKYYAQVEQEYAEKEKFYAEKDEYFEYKNEVFEEIKQRYDSFRKDRSLEPQDDEYYDDEDV